MQSVYESNPAGAPVGSDKAVLAAIAAFVCLAAAASTMAPLSVSIAIVFLFAGPHIWTEIRYFSLKLPARFGKLRLFFCLALAGVSFLGLGYAALVFLGRWHLLETHTAALCFNVWIVAFHAWLAALVCTSWTGKKSIIILLSLSLTAAGALMAPLWFGLALTYLHPVIGLSILDCELQRSRPNWLRPFRLVMLFVPLILSWMIFHLGTAASLPADTVLNQQIARRAGAYLLPAVSSRLLVSLLTFLDLLHYGVWLLALPLASSIWQRYRTQVADLPVAANSPAFRKILSVVFVLSSLMVMLLWLAFWRDYTATRDIYLIVAVFHILAELPFLLWIL